MKNLLSLQLIIVLISCGQLSENRSMITPTGRSGQDVKKVVLSDDQEISASPEAILPDVEEEVFSFEREFGQFMFKVDQLPAGQEIEKFPDLLLKSQILIMHMLESQGIFSKDPRQKGRCILYSLSDDLWNQVPFDPQQLGFSGKKKIAYSQSKNMRSDECQDFFKNVLENHFQSEFYRFHVSFFSFDGE